MTGPPDQDIAARIRALADLSVRELRARYTALSGRATKTCNRVWLTRAVAERMAEHLALPDRNARRAVARALNAALEPRRAASAPPTDPRIPPVGSVLRRAHAGRTVEVHVTKGGFRWEGRAYASLSRIACEATGQRWNGILWFGLRPRQRGQPAARQS